MTRLLAAVVAALMLSGCGSASSDVGDQAQAAERVLTPQMQRLDPCPERADQADVAVPGLPAVILPCLGQGPAVDLAYVRGTPLVVNVWATWCPPCIKEMPLLRAMAEKYSPDVRFLGIDLQDDETSALAMLEEFDITFPSVVDRDGIVRSSLGVSGPPVTFFVQPDGIIAGRWDGLLPNEEIFDALMANYLGITP